MAFKMRSGNKPEFRNIGSSPVKMTLADRITAEDTLYDSEASVPKDNTVEESPVVKSKKEKRKEKKREKKLARHQRKEDRKIREAEERKETGITKTEQLINRVGDWADEKGKSRTGKLVKGIVNTVIDPSSTDVGILAQGGKQMYSRVKDAIKGDLPEDETLFGGEQGLLRTGRDTYRSIKGRKHERLMDPKNTSGQALRYRKKQELKEAKRNTVPLTKKKKY